MHPQPETLREQIYRVIFEANTRAGKAFDVALIFFILLAVALGMQDSVPG